MNLPNRITILRIIIVPIFAAAAAAANHFEFTRYYFIAGLLFAAASITDCIDGKIARRYNLITNFGKFADPLADKILTTTAFLYLMQADACAPFALVLILFREFAVSGIRLLAVLNSSTVIAAKSLGKLKTAFQMISILFFYFGRCITGLETEIILITKILCWISAGITVLSGISYIRNAKNYFIDS